MDTFPVSSDTTIVSESLTSLIPTAARCLVPRSLLRLKESVSEDSRWQKQLCLPLTMTAPSCSGVFFQNIDQKLAGRIPSTAILSSHTPSERFHLPLR